MIVVVTGPSSAGKTTWCQRHYPDQLVPGYAPTGKEPDDSDPAAQAGYWCEVNCQRWLLATQHEHGSGLAVCDDDPLKLHYCWSLMRIGAASPERWARKVAANLAALTEGRLGFADLVLVSIPPVEELRRRRDSDPTRRRRNFELRAQLEVDRVVPASGNLMVGQQQIWLGPARTGLPVVIWVDTERLHVLGVDGGRIKTTASRLSQRDLARLRPDGGRLARPSPLPRVQAELPPAVEVDRLVNVHGGVAVGGKRSALGSHLAGQPVRIRLDGILLHVIDEAGHLRRTRGRGT